MTKTLEFVLWFTCGTILGKVYGPLVVEVWRWIREKIKKEE